VEGPRPPPAAGLAARSNSTTHTHTKAPALASAIAPTNCQPHARRRTLVLAVATATPAVAREGQVGTEGVGTRNLKKPMPQIPFVAKLCITRCKGIDETVSVKSQPPPRNGPTSTFTVTSPVQLRLRIQFHPHIDPAHSLISRGASMVVFGTPHPSHKPPGRWVKSEGILIRSRFRVY
jgi:hypothetical protein